MDDTAPGSTVALRVLLVEDDDADALLVSEHFADADLAVDLHRAHSLAEAEAVLGRAADPDGPESPECVLLDLALPDARDFDGLRRLLATEGPAILVLTGRRDERLGADAVAVGAQDYLVKDAVDGPMLSRAVRYAVERRRSDRVRGALRDAQLRADENARLERGLLPSPLLSDTGLRMLARYEPSEESLLGGDFYDAVECADGSVHAVIGDVCGHGPDEAALGVNLRIAWRTLVLSGIDPDRVLPTMHELLVHERRRAGLFTTLATISVDPSRRHLTLRLAGHPPPVLLSADGHGPTAGELSAERLGRPIGIGAKDTWEPLEVALPPRWSLLLYTDGLIEGRHSSGEVLWTDGLLGLLRDATRGSASWREDPAAMLDDVMDRVRTLSLARSDDVAAVLLVSDR